MIDRNIITMLDSPDPEKRKRAITQLAQTKDRAALQYLATVYRTDSDAEIRELARKAGVYINKHMPAKQAPEPPPVVPSLYDDSEEDGSYRLYDEEDDDLYGGTSAQRGYDPRNPNGDDDLYHQNTTRDEEDDLANVRVSAVAEQRAQGLIQQALDAQMRGNEERAIRYLRQAFEKNPHLMRDSYAAGLASALTGLPSDQAPRRILYGGGSKPGAKASSSGEVTWSDALIDLGIYTLVQMVTFAVTGLLFVNVLSNSFAAAATSNPSVTASTQQTINDIFSGGGIAILAGSLGYGVGALFALMLQYFAIHFVSLTMLDGDGTMPRLIRKLTLFITFGYPVLYFLGNFGTSLMVEIDPNLAVVALLVNIGVLIGISYWSARLVGEAYGYGAGKGCAAFILSTVMFFLLFCACGIVVVLSSGSALAAY